VVALRRLGGRLAGRRSSGTVITLQYVYALQRAAELERALGIRSEADRDSALADAVIAAVRREAWNPDRGLFQDVPGLERYSQQANVMALLVDAQPTSDKRAVMEKVLSDTTLTQATYYFSFYLLEALAAAGLGDRYIEKLEPWRGMLAMGLTTTPERPEPTRSDSHAWSAHPNYGLLATVVGVRPAAPGFSRIRIAPHLGSLRQAAGSIPHPDGRIDVALVRNGENGLTATVTLPAGITGVFEWRGALRELQDGMQVFEF